MKRLFCLLYVAFSLATVLSSDFVYETSSLLRDDDGYVAAFGDFNADKLVDIFAIANNSQRVDVLLAQEDGPFNRTKLISVDSSVITSVVPADFDGDVQMDLLITTHVIGNPNEISVFIYWGDQKFVGHPYNINGTYSDQPFILDYNADMRPDLFVETNEQKRVVWLASPHRNFTAVPFPESSDLNDTNVSLKKPHSNAFVDINGDLTADVFLTTETGFEVWYNQNGVFVHNATYLPPELKHQGQSSFIDLDQDRVLEHILPACLDDKCEKSVIFVYINNEWVQLTGDHFRVTDTDEVWGFVAPGQGEFHAHSNQTFPIALHFADYNMDGYPDAIGILKAPDERQEAVLFTNTPCSDPSVCTKFSRTFRIQPSDALSHINRGVVLSTFFDIYENGIMDVVLTTFTPPTNATIDPNPQPHIVLLRNDLMADACFIKVTVVSGLCYGNCPGDRNPYGVNFPGPSLCYDTVNTDGSSQHSCASQLFQSSHFALQTPYVVFGLGQTPNFIDHLRTGLPQPDHKPKRTKEWPSIIPNSQLIVIPYPADSPDSWLMKLYVAPSHLVYMTAVALLSTCGLVTIIVGILHWREKREDMLEKKQEAQKFHFDAM